MRHGARNILIQFSCLVKFSRLSGTSYTFPVFSTELNFLQVDQLMIHFHGWKGQNVVWGTGSCAIDQVVLGDIQKARKIEPEQNLGFKSMIHKTFS